MQRNGEGRRNVTHGLLPGFGPLADGFDECLHPIKGMFADGPGVLLVVDPVGMFRGLCVWIDEWCPVIIGSGWRRRIGEHFGVYSGTLSFLVEGGPSEVERWMERVGWHAFPSSASVLLTTTESELLNSTFLWYGIHGLASLIVVRRVGWMEKTWRTGSGTCALAGGRVTAYELVTNLNR